MLSRCVPRAAGSATSNAIRALSTSSRRSANVVRPAGSSSNAHKIVVVGGGSAGMAVSHQLLRTGQFTQDDIAVIDPATDHYYQPGFTLVGGGLKNKEEFKMQIQDLVDPNLRFYNTSVDSFTPDDNSVTLGNGTQLTYDHLVVCPGINIAYDSIKGLPEALADANAPVSTIYGYNTCDKVYPTIQKLQKGKAIFTQPAGLIKCAGAPQKAMWLALDHWRQTGLYNPSQPQNSPIQISFATGLPVMFGVPKYSAKLDELRRERGVEGLFQHDLVAVDGDKATFALPDGKQVTKQFDFLHAVPKMLPHKFVAKSPLANAGGLVDVDQGSMQHVKYDNVWSLGDASSLPTSKTAAAVTSQTPILVSNILKVSEGQEVEKSYDGYTSCPLPTEYGKLLLAEFKYGPEPKETFGDLIGFDQAEPSRAFYYLKKDFFPWVYKNHMVKGTWAGPKGFIR